MDKSILDILWTKDNNSEKGHLNLDILNVFNSELKNLAFVGMGYGNIPLTLQFQATLALNYLLDKNFEFKKIPRNKIFHQCDIIPYLDTLALYTGYVSDYQKIKETDENLYNMLMKGPIVPQHYGLSNYGSKMFKTSAEYIYRLNDDLNKNN